MDNSVLLQFSELSQRREVTTGRGRQITFTTISIRAASQSVLQLLTGNGRRMMKADSVLQVKNGSKSLMNQLKEA